MNKFIVKPNKTIEEITRLNKKPKEWLIDESFADLQRRNATFEELQAWLAIPQKVTFISHLDFEQTLYNKQN